MQSRKGLKGTWLQALVSFFAPLLVILGIRWAVIEPYVIPSGSMIPNLLVHDHVFVQKFAFGLRMPFSDSWLFHWANPQPGSVIVFRYPENPEVFFIKRLIGQPGDHITVDAGEIHVNGKKWELESISAKGYPSEEDFDYKIETGGTHPHVVRFRKDGGRGELREWTVPEGQYFMMG